jgi:hypothetical protein
MSQTLSTVTVIGIDIGKNSFHLVGLDRHRQQQARLWPECEEAHGS